MQKNVTLKIGYDADIVSGATPRVYGSSRSTTSGLDAVSSATPFHDTRNAFHAGTELRLGSAAFDAGYNFAFEHDYRSHSIDLGARVDLFGKNTTLKFGYSHNFDSVCDADNRGLTPLERTSLLNSNNCFTNTKGIVSEALAIDSYSMAWNQVLTHLLVAELSLTFQVIDGFQSNPYRRVALFNDTVEAQEAHPLLRERVAPQLRFLFAVPKARAAIGAIGRYYWDTWGVQSVTTELSWEQYVLPALLIRLRGRFYQQGRALFYRDAGETNSYESVGPVGQYFTGDRELSPFRTYTVGGKIAYLKVAKEKRYLKFIQSFDAHIKADFIGYEATTPSPPNEPRSASVIDAIVLELGLIALF